MDLAGVLAGVLEERVVFLSGGPGRSAALAPDMMISRSSAKESFAAAAGSSPAAAAGGIESLDVGTSLEAREHRRGESSLASSHREDALLDRVGGGTCE